MKLKMTFNATCYKVRENVMEPKNKNEMPVKWYQIILDQNDDVATLTCSEDVFTKARRGEDYLFEAQYDDENKRFKVTDIVEFPTETSAPVKPTNGKGSSYWDTATDDKPTSNKPSAKADKNSPAK